MMHAQSTICRICTSLSVSLSSDGSTCSPVSNSNRKAIPANIQPVSSRPMPTSRSPRRKNGSRVLTLRNPACSDHRLTIQSSHSYSDFVAARSSWSWDHTSGEKAVSAWQDILDIIGSHNRRTSSHSPRTAMRIRCHYDIRQRKAWMDGSDL